MGELKTLLYFSILKNKCSFTLVQGKIKENWSAMASHRWYLTLKMWFNWHTFILMKMYDNLGKKALRHFGNGGYDNLDTTV